MKPTIPSPAWDRITRIMEETGRTTLNSFSRTLGLRSASNLDAVRQKGRISRALAKRINDTFPRYSIDWLLAEDWHEEDMERRKVHYVMSINGNPVLGLPFYDDISRYEPDGTAPANHLFRISQSLTNDAQFATVYWSDALSPVIPKRAVVLLRACKTEKVVYNNAYYIISSYSRSWRFIQQGSDAAHLRLTTCRPRVYGDQVILKGQIKNMYAVCAVFVLDPPCK